MWYLIIQYFKFLLKSTNQHGVHSPFIYDLITKCFYEKTDYPEYKDIQNYKSTLKNNDAIISVEDLGPGSRKTKTHQRKVSQIAKISGTNLSRSKLLFRLSKYFKPNQVLELGTSLGIATHAVHLGTPNCNILSIEGCPNISKFTCNRLKPLKNITIENANFSEVLPNLSKHTFDLIFFDGNHQKEATLNYFETLLPTAHNNSVFIFDDIYWSKGMTEAWETIKKHPKVSVTIDTFNWGFVFFRNEQAKEDFVIRL
ncbi:O-methyltransferase [Seonamhaeicola sp. ML3]|uniref:O-methyltransferase n=1 Tax=Seonamhaeicola sp. ML3 TaxID=2937786 RepID=UPI00200D1517|nr:class I SAM-dependent methyltransferase [Seonamhaeicola sp. ML3]